MPKVSVIIPTYNREYYVVKAIDSVLCQKYADYEIIVVDDGSVDNTKEKLNRYGNKIEYVYQDNSGVSAARNAGIRKAQGEWIAFLDSDDEWHPDYLLCQINQIKNNPGACAHFTNANIYEDDKTVNYFDKWGILSLFRNEKYLEVRDPLYFVIKYHLSSVITALINKDVLLKAGAFDERLSYAEDYDLIARTALQGSFVLKRDELVNVYRRDEPINNLTRQFELEGIKSRRAFEIMFKRLIDNPSVSIKERALISKSLSENQRALANLFLSAGKLIEARRYYKESMDIHLSFKSLMKYLISLFPARIIELFIWKSGNVTLGESGLQHTGKRNRDSLHPS